MTQYAGNVSNCYSYFIIIIFLHLPCWNSIFFIDVLSFVYGDRILCILSAHPNLTNDNVSKEFVLDVSKSHQLVSC